MNLKRIGVLVVILLSSVPRLPAAEPNDYPFFPFCIDWHDAKKRSFDEQAAMLKELGYDGVGHIWLDKVPERIKSLDAAGLKLFQITMTVNIAPAAGKPAYDARFKDVLSLLKGRNVQFDLLVSGMKKSDPAGDDRAVALLCDRFSGYVTGTTVAVDGGIALHNWITPAG